jgi:transposase
MTDLEHETDIERLRARAIELYLENERLAARVAELAERLAQASEPTEVATLRAELAEAKAKLAQHAKKQFGRSSERRTPPPPAPKPEPKAQTGHGPTPQPDLERRPVEHSLDAADKVCPKCGGQLEEIPGEFEEAEEIDIDRIKPFIRVHKRKKYACQCRECLETAMAPPKLIVGGRYATHFAAHIAAEKYDAGLPLERCCKLLGRLKLKVTTQALFDQCWAMGCHLEPTYKAVREDLVARNSVLHMDESLWRLLEGERAGRWYVWTLVGADSVWYGFDPSRGADTAAEFLKGFQGHLMTDGYAAYKNVAARWAKAELRLIPVYCWSHVRRGFLEAEQSFPSVVEVIKLIDALFVIERKVDGLVGDVRLRRLEELRRTESAPVAEAIKIWLDACSAIPGSRLHGAVQYALNHWDGLIRFLEDPTVPLSNNAAERSLRSPVLGRKVHYGSRSERGTKVAAIFYTLIECARLCGLEPVDYLTVATERAILNPGTVTLPREYAAELAAQKSAAPPPP